MNKEHFFEGFSKLNRKDRLQKLLDFGALDKKGLQFLEKSEAFFSSHLLDTFIENGVGYFQMPMGVVPHLMMDGRSYVVPMVVEETSVVAAASKMAKWIKEEGEIQTQVLGRRGLGQIQIGRLKGRESLFFEILMKKKPHLIEEVNQKVVPGLFRRGGGMKDLKLRFFDRPGKGKMAVIDVFVDCVDAMGANSINQVCEFLRAPVEKLTSERVSMCILSNLSDQRLVRAEISLPYLERALVEKIEEASLFALKDPYRASTHNKGIMNAIDAILIATGNDWRAVEAGVHAYAALGGSFQREDKKGESGSYGYSPVAVWRGSKKGLKGCFEAPLSLGVVGGMTALHPMAALSLRILKVQTSDELARVCAAMGLVQNLGALMALTTSGIVRGHMKLHIRNLILSSGATKEEVPSMQEKLEKMLAEKNTVSLRHAVQALEELRKESL